MEHEFVTIERAGRIATVRFDRGDDVNALSPRVMEELLAAARSFENDFETSVVVLTGSARAFTYGYDLKHPDIERRARAGLGERRQMIAIGAKLCRAWEELEPFTIAAIEGYCVGGGVALVAALDFRVCGRGATFIVPEIKLGMNMSWQSLPRLVGLMGPARTKQLAILADPLPAGPATEWGLVQDIADDGDAYGLALDYARRVADKPPIPVRMIKQATTQAANALGHAVSFMDRDQYALAATSEDFEEGVRAFREKRPPEFKGR